MVRAAAAAGSNVGLAATAEDDTTEDNTARQNAEWCQQSGTSGEGISDQWRRNADTDID